MDVRHGFMTVDTMGLIGSRQISNRSDFLSAASDGKLLECGQQLHHLFIDFKAADDSIVRVKLYTAMREFGIPTKLVRLTSLTLTNVRGQIKAAGSRLFDINNVLRQGDALSCVLFNLALESVIRDVEVNARGTILFKSIQLLAYADDIDIMRRTTRDVKTAFIQIEQVAIGARSWAAHR